MDTLNACIKSAIAGGKAIENLRPAKAETKGDKHVGHHAIVTEADFISQNAILKELKKRDPAGFFITEEIVKDKDIQKKTIGSNELEKLKKTRVYVIDELDGSSSFNAGHYEWSTSVGCVENLVHVAGAVFAPKIEGGTLFFASKNNGSFVEANGKRKKIGVSNNGIQNAYVIVGPDNFLSKYPLHNKLLTKLGDATRTMNGNGSCALALGIVAAGRADALVQPIQNCWDWAAGKVILEEAGGVMIFYGMDNGRIMPIKKLGAKHYDPDRRAAGFVAGNEKIAAEVVDILTNIKQNS